MSSDERLLAWIERREGVCLASFVAKSTARQRAPATRRFASQDEARQWVTNEAEAVRAPVEWVTDGAVRDRAPHAPAVLAGARG
jgi:hypothetical protein